MKNMAESMPKPSQAPKPLDVQPDEIEGLLKSLDEADAAEKAGVSEKEPTYEELLAEAEQSMNADIEASKTLGEKSALSDIAELVAASEIDDQFETLSGMVNRPEDIAKHLMDPVVERVKQALDPKGGFGKKHENPQVRELYARFDRKARLTAFRAVVDELGERLENEKDPAKISTLHKLLEAVETADPGPMEQ